jgi:hypothetical protein
MFLGFMPQVFDFFQRGLIGLDHLVTGWVLAHGGYPLLSGIRPSFKSNDRIILLQIILIHLDPDQRFIGMQAAGAVSYWFGSAPMANTVIT